MKYKTKYHNILTKDFLIKEYIKNKKSTVQIAKKVGCTPVTVLNYLKRYKIKIRTKSKARALLDILGKNNSNYTDGRCSKQHYCIEEGCDNKICLSSFIAGNGRCKSCGGKRPWLNEEFKDKQLKASLKGRELTPNKPETILIKLLNKLLPKQYRFVGAGKLIIDGFCPDFINKDNNKIIELYGNYWHTIKGAKEKDKRRLIAYKKHDYKTLIIWEKELKDLSKVKNKILKFEKEEKIRSK